MFNDMWGLKVLQHADALKNALLPVPTGKGTTYRFAKCGKATASTCNVHNIEDVLFDCIYVRCELR
jgi:hypothetical protein